MLLKTMCKYCPALDHEHASTPLRRRGVMNDAVGVSGRSASQHPYLQLLRLDQLSSDSNPSRHNVRRLVLIGQKSAEYHNHGIKVQVHHSGIGLEERAHVASLSSLRWATGL